MVALFRRSTLLGTVIVTVALSTGCSSQHEQDPLSEPLQTEVALPDDLPVLLVRDLPDTGALEAAVSGPIRVNKKNCVTVDDWLVSTPTGSAVWPDGNGVRLEGIGEYRFGQDLPLTSGGWLDDDPTDFTEELREQVRNCGSNRLVVIYADPPQ